MNYVENHDLRVDESGSAGAHVTVRIQDTDLETARRFVRSILGVAETFSWEGDDCILPETHYEPGGGAIEREIVILRPPSGPCVHYGPDGCEVPRGDCPHLDNLEILCPVKDACAAMSEVARMRDACEAEQGHRDADAATGEPVYETTAPEWVEPAPEEAPAYTIPARPKGRAPAHVKEWTAEEDAAIRDAATRAESVTLYRSAVPDSGRSDAAIQAQWYKKVRPGLCEARDPLPDFVGDVVPVTQCEEPVFLPGDRVRIKHALHRGQTGEIRRYFPATENYLVAIDGMPDMIVLRDKDLEVEA
ncbi:MAG: hypothetical protein GX885_11565 [Methanomicrobiales archaeon]|nr:hypothetical protein [Methanomicrobiales archaeon]